MTDLRPVTEADVLRIIKRDGRYFFNPLAYRNRKKFVVAESMAKRGLITKHPIRPDYTEYRSNANRNQETKPARDVQRGSRLAGGAAPPADHAK